MFKSRVLGCIVFASAVFQALAGVDESGIFTYDSVDVKKSANANCDQANALVGTSVAYARFLNDVYAFPEHATYSEPTNSIYRLTPSGVIETLTAQNDVLTSTVAANKCVYNLKVTAGKVLGVKGAVPADENAIFHIKGTAFTPDAKNAGCPQPGNYYSWVVAGPTVMIEGVAGTLDKVKPSATFNYKNGVVTMTPSPTNEGYMDWAWAPKAGAAATCTVPLRVQDGTIFGIKPPKSRHAPKRFRV